MPDNDDYWKGWPAKGEYMKDLLWAERIAIQYLDRISGSKGNKQQCVVFDIDDTIVFGDPSEVIGVREMELGTHEGQCVFILPRNKPVVRIAEHAKKLGMTIVLLTARPKESRLASKVNMDEYNIPYHAIIMNEKDEDYFFKIRVRRNIESKYDIVLTIGDQITDCMCPGTSAAIKLPDPDSLCSYAWIPPIFKRT